MGTTTLVQDCQEGPLGSSVPPVTPHCLSVSLPTWKDTVGYMTGEKRVIDAMVSGYPRFVIPLNVRKLASICEQRFGVGDERALLCPSRKLAEHCGAFLVDHSTRAGSPVSVRLVDFTIRPPSEDGATSAVVLYVVFYPLDAEPLAKEFWMHTGLGISSRRADLCLILLGEETSTSKYQVGAISSFSPHGTHENGLDAKHPSKSSATTHTVCDYVEERPGENGLLESAADAKRTIRRRIAELVSQDAPVSCSVSNGAEGATGKSTRGGRRVEEGDVFLFPGGMAAIWHAHQMILGVGPPMKSVCFGFPYCDTVKILEKWGPGCHFYGSGDEQDFAELVSVLERGAGQDPSVPPISALFTEFPSNPRLRSPDLLRLRELADKYGFPIIVDETIGNFANVDVLPHVDVIVTSLSKIFSGKANVMGGSLVLNPDGRHYASMKARLSAIFEDTYFDEDAIHMERNSRDFRARIARIDANALAVCEFLRSRSLAFAPPPSTAPATPPLAIKDIFYPKWITPENYDRCRRAGGGYGGLLTLTFVSMAASRAFYDALPCAKGPSLGTNFTLACPYTILAHYWELPWAAGWGVEEGIVRISVGLEDRETLMRWVGRAVEAAEEVVRGEMEGERLRAE